MDVYVNKVQMEGLLKQYNTVQHAVLRRLFWGVILLSCAIVLSNDTILAVMAFMAGVAITTVAGIAWAVCAINPTR